MSAGTIRQSYKLDSTGCYIGYIPFPSFSLATSLNFSPAPSALYTSTFLATPVAPVLEKMHFSKEAAFAVGDGASSASSLVLAEAAEGR